LRLVSNPYAVYSQYEYLSQLDLKELGTYFEIEQEESERVEYKSGELAIRGLFKEVCAFANTDGGVIIYGAPREVTDTQSNFNGKARRKVCKGPLCPTREDRTTDSFIQTLMTGITPAIVGIKIKKHVVASGFVYVITIPESINSPHQVDGTYYIRIGTMSTPAPHGIVHALFNKKRPTKLVANVAVKTAVLTDYYNDMKLQIHIGNQSRYPVHSVEGFVALIGDIREVDTKKFSTSVTPDHKWYLHTELKCPTALVNNFWWSPQFENLHFHGHYFYMQLYLWAYETEAITKLYKIGMNGIIEETDMADDTPSRQEVDNWNGRNK
jgi:hypothetical protein